MGNALSHSLGIFSLYLDIMDLEISEQVGPIFSLNPLAAKKSYIFISGANFCHNCFMIGVPKNSSLRLSLLFVVMHSLQTFIPCFFKSLKTCVDVSRAFLVIIPELGPKAGKIRRITIAISLLQEISMPRSSKNLATLSNHFPSWPLFSQWW